MLHLAGHYRLGHAATFEMRDHTAQLADTDPEHVLRNLVDVFIRFLFYRDNRDRGASPTGAVENKKRELTVSRY